MNFRSFLEMAVDKWDQSEMAEQAAKHRISAAAGGAFREFADFSVMRYTSQELRELGHPVGKWVGQYVKGSVESGEGITVLLQIDRHNNQNDMSDTLIHEVGHALWEVLYDESKVAWNQANANYRYGAEEAFADDFMRLCNGQVYLMNNRELFLQITT